MIYFVIYVVVGLVLGWMFKTEGDRPAVMSGLEYVFLFAFFWPFIVLYTIQRMMKEGFTLKWRGKKRHFKGSRER